ncbi:unnamed protein product [Rangifer tarandus platyrhynchus]|uniref:Zinc transporter ZIP11 n=1 Tax=Rangifer tarandus platyrhynchus TaxID=3082113 RepID=A0ABN8ZFV5_RANTA|nr:unnamed protein product [Rangifer tarandus platyrhynchus]
MATASGGFGSLAFLPVAVGFALGAAFVYLADLLMPHWGAEEDPQTALALNLDPALTKKSDTEGARMLFPESELSIRIGRAGLLSDKSENGEAWRRIALLILAITIHNIPEGLAVGVGFGAVGKTASATFESARNLALGIGIQNFPEGLAVSLPLRGAGFSTWRAFWYGQLSGMVEPLAGVFGAFAVVLAEPILPYALAFAAGAMVYVIMDDIIPETQISAPDAWERAEIVVSAPRTAAHPPPAPPPPASFLPRPYRRRALREPVAALCAAAEGLRGLPRPASGEGGCGRETRPPELQAFSAFAGAAASRRLRTSPQVGVGGAPAFLLLFLRGDRSRSTPREPG